MGKKAKKGRLPKEVLGVKLPKELRKAGDQLIEHAASPQGRQAIAGALTMAAAAATAAMARGRDNGRDRASDAGEPAQGTTRAPDPQAVADVVGKAAEAVLGKLFGKPA
ncbi:hypothetical protein [Sphingomonas adhaesiva]|uniref:hypothetical protein n=1 Tax=Sphingomonas adhaesiva TaxID=28212 RepID=UPI002FFC9919